MTTRFHNVTGVAIATGLACALLIAGCASDIRNDAAPRTGASSAPTPPASYPPVATGSTDVAPGKTADRLIAQIIQHPPRTHAVDTAPDPLLAKPRTTIGCGAAQRSVFWIAEGWTLDAFADWLKANPAQGYSASAAEATENTNGGLIIQATPNHRDPSGIVQHFLYWMTRLDGGSVGVRVEAEAGPIQPCAHTQDGTGDD